MTYTDKQIREAACVCADPSVECPEGCPLAECEDCNAVMADYLLRRAGEESRPSSRAGCLARAREIVVGKRSEYGDPEDNFTRIARMWEAYLKDTCVEPYAEVCVTAADVAHMMILLKVVRASSEMPKADNYVDIAGYAACACEIECE